MNASLRISPPADPQSNGWVRPSRGTRGASDQSGTLRPRVKLLPEHARRHNISLVLQTLFGSGACSRADISRITGLTRVTISDLVAELISDRIVIELGQRQESRPGKPAILIDIDRSSFHIVGIDLSESAVFRGAILDLDGVILERAEVEIDGAFGPEASALVAKLVSGLVDRSSAPILGIGVGSPGIVDGSGVVLTAPNLGWVNEPLEASLASQFAVPVVVANDANVSALAEYGFGGADGDMMLVKIGRGVGAGLLLGGTLLRGSRFAAGEIGHVIVDTDEGQTCACGKSGCLETWLGERNLQARLDAVISREAKEEVLWDAGERLGIALAPVVGALNLAEVILSGPAQLLDGPFARAAIDTLRYRTLAEIHGALAVRMTALGPDIVLRGAATMVLSRELGVS